ncbi:ABC transporter permease [Streptomyces olivaceus]|uniref:Transport permease protein n=1 Tax=Streptomyces olivaceus TaxID=47716 RepID=A0ABS7WEU9_STROV|nr:ABC transporter permease [Streptomyces olivaceus]MBZ6093624.1 ABC transporter permease [Streptomyces olivaceus]MBZ6100709.1 ABC transporter permease [Streptomyces olivaceus]MBZ6121807.1 ABC transporter permease [Streptomyces olivaceus]MBZ6156502.1 ABC transporter permease [Streptomyces olivaceus]MBZ6204854.1 ABC transporter permease [Streptomyces olivaceus]
MTSTSPPPARLTAAPVPAWQGSGLTAQLLILTGRSVRANFTHVKVVVLSMLQPVFMLLLLSQVFGAIVDRGHLPDGVAYLDFLLPALLVTTGIGPAVASGIGLVRDMDNGAVARLRTLPIHAPLLLFARSFADLLRTTAQLVILVVVAVVFLDADPAGGPLGLLAAVLLTCVVVWAMTWIFLALGAWLRNPEAMQSAGYLVTFPLMFASSAFVPKERLPDWLQVLATVNPLSYAMEANRALALDQPLGSQVWSALGAGVLVATVGSITAVRVFLRPPA